MLTSETFRSWLLRGGKTDRQPESIDIFLHKGEQNPTDFESWHVLALNIKFEPQFSNYGFAFLSQPQFLSTKSPVTVLVLGVSI